MQPFRVRVCVGMGAVHIGVGPRRASAEQHPRHHQGGGARGARRRPRAPGPRHGARAQHRHQGGKDCGQYRLCSLSLLYLT